MAILIRFFLLLAIVVSLQGCKGLLSGDNETTVDDDLLSYIVGGTVTGLTGTVSLQNNVGDDITTSANTSFTFATTIADGTAYNVTVSSQPAGQTCSVTSGSGIIAGADVTNVDVSCVDDVIIDYTVGGTVSGLTGTVTLQNNAGDDITTSANASFTFATAIADGTAYNVTVSSQPAGQICTVSNGNGTIAGANVTNVGVNCSDIVVPTYSVGGTVNGLTGTVTLQNNAGDDLTTSANASFTFATTIVNGAAYNVTVSSQPTGQTCSVTSDSGTIAGANVTNVGVSCVTDVVSYTVGGTVSGLNGLVTLQNNGGDDLTTSANTSFTFATVIVNGTAYNVTVSSQPAGQTCTVSNGSGTIVGANVTNANVNCVTNVSNDASLTALSMSGGGFDQVFQSNQFDYTATVAFTLASTSISTTLAVNATGTVNGVAIDGRFDTSDPIPLDEGDNTIVIVVTAEDGVTTNTYTIVVTRQSAIAFAQQAYIKASNTGFNDQFGNTVALSGDTLAVAAYVEDGDGSSESNNSASNSGAVYVFTRTSGVWSQQAYLKAFNIGANDLFGISLTLSGDTLAVGATSEDGNYSGVNAGDGTDNSAGNSGAVYVFTRTGTTWSQQAYIKGSNTQSSDSFGRSVSLSGDTLAVGAMEFVSSNGFGAVYVFTRTASVWSQQAYLKASNADFNDLFGDSVALDGDTLAVGAPEEDGDGSISENESGAVYVFTRSGVDWSQQAYLKASNPDRDDKFGTTLALSANTLVVGVPDEDSDGSSQSNNLAIDSGAVYVFTRSGVDWSQQAYIKASNVDADDLFGISVGLDGDSLVIGATHENSNSTGINAGELDNTASRAGAAYFYARSGTNWIKQAYIKASNTDAGDRFGNSVAISGDTLVIGAIGEQSSATGIDGDQTNDASSFSGAVYVFQ